MTPQVHTCPRHGREDCYASPKYSKNLKLTHRCSIDGRWSWTERRDGTVSKEKDNLSGILSLEVPPLRKIGAIERRVSD